MSMRRALAAAVVLIPLATGQAAAQFPGQEPPCLKDFAVLRNDTEKKGMAIKAASDRHVPASEACHLLNLFTVAEAKMIKYAETNAAWCGIPPDVVKQMKQSHAKALNMRTVVCKAAAAPAAPAGPSLSDALGAPIAVAPDSIKPGRGTFDTLTGTPLGRK